MILYIFIIIINSILIIKLVFIYFRICLLFSIMISVEYNLIENKQSLTINKLCFHIFSLGKV